MPGARHPRRFRTHSKSLLAFLIEGTRASRELFVDLALAGLAHQFSECAKEKLLAAGMPRDSVVNPNEAVDSLTRLVVADYRDEFLKCVRRWVPASSAIAPNDGDYLRADIAAAVTNTHKLVGVSLKKTADFLNEGIPTCAPNAHKLKPKTVYDARKTYFRVLEKHVKDTDASWGDIEALARVNTFHMSALLELHLHARAVKSYKSLRGSALAKALVAREDFAGLLDAACRLVRARELSDDPFATRPIESNASQPDAASPPDARRGSHVKQRPPRS